MRNRPQLAFKFLHRDWRSGELNILAVALIIAVACTTTVSLFGDRLHRTMENQAAEFLAADLVITSHGDMPDIWTRTAKQYGLDVARTAEFNSVVLNGDALLLAGIKACTPGYPLRGHLKTTTKEISDEVITHEIPSPGMAWVERRVLERLGFSIGDQLEVGEKPLEITRIITYEPDRKGNFLSLSPRIMMNYQDLPATRVIQPGSHVHYFYLFAGAEKQVSAYKQWVFPEMNPNQRIMDIHEERPELGTALSRAEQYLGLVSIVVVLIAGVAIAMATRRYSERHFNVTAMMRCLGLKQNDIIVLYVMQLAMVGVICGCIGYGIGWVGQEILVYLLRDFLPKQLSSPSWYALILGISTGLITLTGFALPPILRLRRVSALKVFRRDLMPLPPSIWLVYGLAFSTLLILMWRYTEDLKMTLYVTGIGFGSLIVLSVFTLMLLRLCPYLMNHVGLGWRFGLQNLSRQPQTTISQILAFCITLTAMLIIILVRTDLIEAWKIQLPEKAQNHFALNIFPDSVDGFKAYLKDENIDSSAFYAIVRGRLLKINDIDLTKIVEPGSYSERVTNRDFSMTSADRLPTHNKIVKGSWNGIDRPIQVSVEQKLAKSLGVDIGDRLTFGVGSEWFIASVSSIRSVQWDAMKPTFYMMFSPGSLEGYPGTYLTSFFLPSEDKLALNRMIKRFPTVTVLEVDFILERFRMIIKQVSTSVEFILVFAVLAGFTVLFAAVRSSIDNRIFEGSLLRALGASRRLLRTSRIVEFCGLGFLSGLLAAITAELITWALYSYTFQLEYHVNWLVWTITPMVGAVSIGLAGYLGTRIVLNESPMNVLREL